MKFLKATISSTTDLYEGKTDFFNLDRILEIQPHKSGTSKILMGAGLYWDVYTDTMEIVELGTTEALSIIKEANK